MASSSIFSYTALFFTLLFVSFSIGANSEEKSIITIRTEKTTHLHFYFQDVVGGENPTAVKIIGDGHDLGTTFMMDDALTESKERDSKVIGRAQGMYSIATQNDFAFLMVVTFVFTEGEYNGSSISMLGRNHVMDDVREMPIVGGSGVFRLGRGYALAHTVWFDAKTGDASVEYNVFVQHDVSNTRV